MFEIWKDSGSIITVLSSNEWWFKAKLSLSCLCFVCVHSKAS